MASAEKVTVQEEQVVTVDREIIRVELTEREALLLRTLGGVLESREVWSIVDDIGVAAGVALTTEAEERLGIRCVVEGDSILHVAVA